MPPPTPIYYAIKQYLEDQYTRLDKAKITYWLMQFSANLATDIDDCRGGRIRIGGVKFEGSPRHVFWSFIRPCLQDIISEAITRAVDLGRKHQPKVAHVGFDETATLLRDFVTRVYRRMVEIDRRLRGSGYPERVAPYDPSPLIQFLHANIDAQVASLKTHYPVGLGRLRAHLAENPQVVLTTFGVGTVIGGLLLALIKHLFSL